MAFSTMRTFSLDLASKQGDRPNDADFGHYPWAIMTVYRVYA